jgi:hypothetical protein
MATNKVVWRRAAAALKKKSAIFRKSDLVLWMYEEALHILVILPNKHARKLELLLLIAYNNFEMQTVTYFARLCVK